MRNCATAFSVIGSIYVTSSLFDQNTNAINGNAASITILDSQITNGEVGIGMPGGGTLRVDNTLFRNLTVAIGGTHAAISINNSHVTQSTPMADMASIMLQANSYLEINGSTFSNNSWAIYATEASSVVCDRSNFTNNSVALLSDAYSAMSVHRSIFSSNINAISSLNSIFVADSLFTSNSPSLYCRNNTCSVSGGSFVDNGVSAQIQCEYCNLDITGTEFSGNGKNRSGSAIRTIEASVNIRSITVFKNSAFMSVINLAWTTGSISASSFSYNSAFGSIVSCTACRNLTVDDCTFEYNTAGDALGVSNGNLTARNCTFKTNDGRAFSSSQSNVTVDSSEFANNNGVALYSNNNTNFLINNSVIHHNAGRNTDLGVGVVAIDSPVQLVNTTLEYNQANSTAAGLYAFNSDVFLEHSLFHSNSAPLVGGGLFMVSSTLSSRRTTFSANYASIGAGVYLSGCNATFTDSTFELNEAQRDGGGMKVTNSEVEIDHSNILLNTAKYGGSDREGEGVEGMGGERRDKLK